MSNIEHLVENSINATRLGGHEQFNKEMDLSHNVIMLEAEKDKISKDVLWEIAQYIVYSHDEILLRKYIRGEIE